MRPSADLPNFDGVTPITTQDHLLDAGQSIELGATSSALVEGWRGDAVVAWQAAPSTPRRPSSRLRLALSRCWELMNPIARIGLGSSAALAALVAGELVFGPLSQARLQTLIDAPSLHNPSHIGSGLDAETMRHVDPSRAVRARVAAQEARRRAAGAA